MAEVVYIKELTWLSILLLVGVVSTAIAYRLKLPDVLLLLIIGIVIGNLDIVKFDSGFLTSLAIFALVMIIFESTSKFRPREISALSPYAFELAFVFLLMNIVLLTLLTHILFGGSISWNSLLLSGIFAGVMSGTAPETVFSLLREKTTSKITEILQLESIINTPLIVIFPLILLRLYLGIILTAGIIVTTFLKEIMTGVGTGIVLGLVTFRVMKKSYKENISPLVLVALALVTYTLATYLEGDGVLAVTSLGVIFGMFQLKSKESMQKFISIFTNFLKIVVFVLLGLIIAIPLDKSFLLKSVILFGFYLLVRFSAVNMTFRKSIDLKEKLFMTLSISKGVAVAVVAFTLAATVVSSQIQTFLDLIFLFILYSTVTASIAAGFSRYFLKAQTTLREIKSKR